MKTIVVTGGSRGIGLAIAQKFWDESYEVFCLSRFEHPSKENWKYVKCDIRDKKQVEEFAKHLHSKQKKVDTIINNAGIAGSNSLDVDSGDELWYDIIATNLHGPYHVCKALLPLLAHGGSIINITSVLAHTGVPDQTAYCAAKHGLMGFTKALAKNLAEKKITVNAIAPGWVETEMSQKRMDELQLSKSDLCEMVPLKRFINGEEIAQMAYYLAGPNSRGITGQSFVIDGGFLS
ncbi:MAG: SDR family oxidoreductase [Oligoflexales bacterium]|nr:SDR family oxidoreductase [Oligoflexales bacterium]